MSDLQSGTQTIDAEQQIPITLKAKHWAIILRGLQAGRYDEVRDTIDAVQIGLNAFGASLLAPVPPAPTAKPRRLT